MHTASWDVLSLWMECSTMLLFRAKRWVLPLNESFENLPSPRVRANFIPKNF